MSKRFLASVAIAALMICANPPRPFAANAADPPEMDTAATMQGWLKLSELKLTDDQVTKLVPVVATRIEKVDAALAKVEAADEPDVMGFIEEYGAIKKEFNAGVTNLLTPDQSKQWGSIKDALEKDLVQAGASKQLVAMKTSLKLTDDQVIKLQPSMAVATQKKLDALQKLADSGRIGMRDKLGAKRAMGDINSELEKSMSTVMSPDQIATYKASKEKKKS